MDSIQFYYGKYIFAIAVVIATVLGLWWYFDADNITEEAPTTEEALEVLSEAPPVTVETNPVKKVPDLNPIEKTNPFRTFNPFE